MRLRPRGALGAVARQSPVGLDAATFARLSFSGFSRKRAVR
jgi:hypothetical protein